MNDIFPLRTICLMWVGGSVGWGQSQSPSPPLPPGSFMNGLLVVTSITHHEQQDVPLWRFSYFWGQRSDAHDRVFFQQ